MKKPLHGAEAYSQGRESVNWASPLGINLENHVADVAEGYRA
jgi:hypothetical protein